ncbi:MAG: Uncharacterized protein FD134_1606 [Gallionellaceae bacterium]|nr:MAG: Uncharacterized protein FD134_1606 [Gallionellaceae bacterium]
MKSANILELHYYFGDNSHEIDAVLRNKSEAELLGIILEAATLLEIDASLIKEAYKEGGFRDFWKALGKSSPQITLLLLIVQIIISTIPIFDPENKELEIEEKRLSIEEKKLNIKKLEQDITNGKQTNSSIEQVAKSVGVNLKIIKRKSNFFSSISEYRKVEQVGFSVLDNDWQPVSPEKLVPRSDFGKFVLSTNKLKSEEDDGALIEIISPVLKEGRYKWKGIYNKTPISFEMQDTHFRDAVLFENIPFQHGSKIICVLITHRELDEVGEIKVTGYSVTTVLEKVDDNISQETPQGKKYRHAKKLVDAQQNLFDSH